MMLIKLAAASVILQCVIIITFAAHMPPFLNACNISDPNIFECEKSSAVEAIPQILKGYPPFKIPALSPYHVEHLEVDLTPELHVKLRNGSLYGIENAHIETVHLDPTSKGGHVSANFPYITVLGQYVAKGQLMMMPINGDGNINITIKNVEVTFFAEWNVVQRKNMEYARIGNHNVSIDFVGGNCKLTNLFSDNPQMAKMVDKLLDDNFKDIFQEVKPSVEAVVSHIINSVASKLFRNVPYVELFLK